MVWRAQAATTPAEYKAAIQDLSDVSVTASVYLNAVEPKKWALYPYYKTLPLYGWRTTNFVETEQAKSLRLKPRKLLPYDYFRAYVKIMMTEAHLRLCQAKTWAASVRITTLRSESKFQCELKQMPQYSVSFSSDEVAYTSRSGHGDKPLEVKLSRPSCSCVSWLQHGIPCRHLLAVKMKMEGGLEGVFQLFSSCYTVAQYAENQSPNALPDDSEKKADKALTPALYQRQAGRPRKRRIRSRGERGEPTRIRKHYKCDTCAIAAGHNKASCTGRT